MAYEQLKEKIKESPVSLILGSYISLSRKGSNLEAICPFHADTKPSLKVNDNKGMYKCFACGAGGDAITFVMNYKKVDFTDALKEISVILGIPFEDQKEKKKNPKAEMALRVLNASVKLYRKIASLSPLAYVEFLEKRKMNQETTEKWSVGFSLGNNGLLKYLESLPAHEKKEALSVAKEIGLIKVHETRNTPTDFYRERVMFPIHDHSGQVRGFSSRAVHPNQLPKYLNSSESLIFDKGSILFGFLFAKNAIRQSDHAIIVEGNIDVIMMHQFGFNQTVGIMGTAMSDYCVRMLSNMTKNIYLALDSDEAGKKAMHKINSQFMALGVLPRLIDFGPQKDPDEFLLQQGRLALLERIEKAPLLIDVEIQSVIPEKIPENTDQKLNALHAIFSLVAPLKDELSATERIIEAAKTLGLKSDSTTILDRYKEMLSHQKDKNHLKAQKSKLQETEEKVQQSLTEAQKLHDQFNSQESARLSKSERLFLREIVCHPEFLTHLKLDEFLATVGHDEVKKLVHWLVKIYFEMDDAEYVSIVQEHLQYGGYSKEIIDTGTEALFHYGNKYNEKVIIRMLKDYLFMLKTDQLKTRRKELVEKQKIVSTQGEVDHILKEISRLDKEILSLKNTVA